VNYFTFRPPPLVVWNESRERRDEQAAESVAAAEESLASRCRGQRRVAERRVQLECRMVWWRGPSCHQDYRS